MRDNASTDAGTRLSTPMRAAARLLAAGVAGLALALATQAIATATPADPGAKPPIPTIGKYSTKLARPLTASELRTIPQKQSKASHHPEADTQYSTPGYQLPFQPNGTWYHWWSARAYKNGGNTTGINDPAAWANNTEQWATTTGGAHTVVMPMGGRGYIW